MLVANAVAAHAQTPSSPAHLPRLEAGSVVHSGSFTVPAGDGEGGDLTFGSILGLGARGNSLIWADHAWYKGVCEVSIPALGQRASVVQRCADVDEGMLHQMNTGSGDTTIYGALPWNGRMIWSAASFYDANGSAQYSHFVSGQTFSTRGDVQGPHRIAAQIPAAAAGGYFGIVPAEWRAALGGPALTGNCCLSIIWRTSSGPAVSVFNPDDVGQAGSVAATPLIFYPSSAPLASNSEQNSLFNWTTEIAAVAFPPGTRSVLFFGRHGTGAFCYGDGSACNDPVDGSNGTHAYPYVHQVWAYDAVDLAAVARGERSASSVRPYATWQLPGMNSTGSASVAGGTYDPATGRLFLAQRTGNGDQTVHVYQVGTTATSQTVIVDETTPAEEVAPPGPPSALTARVQGAGLNLSWTAPLTGGDPTSYIVEAGTASGRPTHVLPVGPSTTARFAGVPNGRYYIRVRAKNDAGTSQPSPQVRATVGCVSAPPTPQGLVGNVNGNVVQLSWSEQEGCSDTRYQVRVGSRTRAADIATLSTDDATVSATAPPGDYYVRVAAMSRYGMSAFSQEVKLTVGRESCAPPQLGLTLKARVSRRRVTLSWKAATGGVDAVFIRGYVVEVGTTPGGSQLSRIELGKIMSMSTTAPAGTFYVRVRPVDACGAGLASNEVALTVR